MGEVDKDILLKVFAQQIVSQEKTLEFEIKEIGKLFLKKNLFEFQIKEDEDMINHLNNFNSFII